MLEMGSEQCDQNQLRRRLVIKINLTSVMVDDQDKALRFYTEVLGFWKKPDIPVGQFKWLTVVSPDAPDGIELVLEPNAHPAAKTFQQALFVAGLHTTSMRRQ